MRQIHPLSLRHPYGARGKSKKCDFCFFSIFLERFLQSFQSGVNSKEGDNAAGIVPLFAIVRKITGRTPLFCQFRLKRQGNCDKQDNACTVQESRAAGDRKKERAKGKGQKRERAAGDKRARKRKRLHSTGRWGKQSPAQCRKVGAAGEKDKTGFGGGGAYRKKGDDRRK